MPKNLPSPESDRETHQRAAAVGRDRDVVVAGVTDRQRKLHASITVRSSNVPEQLALLIVQANRVGASEADVRAVRERLLADHVNEEGTKGEPAHRTPSAGKR